ncbi:hypothetical protein M8C21_005216 [Ambrosia artemisiifolia]|uniref:histidine kinase n=1 Tax=Ambrosia artemisiifolia TaxID=4212 RepID=A0AAD5CCD1_AMBAR|nr:hypothetical protein M8C21_005216 [Ambrosia artemisiifolia]
MAREMEHDVSPKWLENINEPSIVDFERLVELTSYSEVGSSQLAYLVKNWEYKQENYVRLLREELENLNKQQRHDELKKLEIYEQHCFEEENYGGDKPLVSVFDEVHEIFQDGLSKRNDVVEKKPLDVDAEYDTVTYQKQQALHFRKLLEENVHREQILMEKLEESITYLEKQSSPIEELSQILKRADNFLHFVLHNAPIVIGHQDKELRYRFIYNHFPSLVEEFYGQDIIGKTDVEIYKGSGVKEFLDFKREVLERGLPAKREITFVTQLFGAITFLMYVEPVFSKDGEKIGVNYMGMEITDQVKKMAKHRQEIALPKDKETELNKTIHITGLTTRNLSNTSDAFSSDDTFTSDLAFVEEPSIVDFKRLVELTSYSEKGSSQLAYLVKNWEYKQENVVRLLRKELENLSKQQRQVELKKLEIYEQHRFEEESYGGDKRPVSVLDEVYEIFQDVPRKKNDVIVENKQLEIDADYDTVTYWKQQALHLGKLLEASVQREQVLSEKLEKSIENLEKQSSPVEELSQILKRADNFLHFVLQNAPVVIGHQDKELRYRFIYNHFPSLVKEDVIGKIDVEIFKGGGVKELQDFKRDVLERGLPAKREITFETELFGAKTFLVYVEPVFSKDGEKIGVNYVGMEITDQVKKREKIAKLREEIAVQKAKEMELKKAIHIIESNYNLFPNHVTSEKERKDGKS